MLACYPPHFSPVRIGELPADSGSQHILLYRKFWLVIHWQGLRDAPRPVSAKVSAYGRSIEIAPERLRILSRAAFDEWYTAHWNTFMHPRPSQ